MCTKNNYLKIIFAGSSSFSLNQINILYKYNNVKILAILTKKDNKKLTRNKILFNPIKNFAIKNDILLLQPSKFDNKIKNIIENLNPDFIIVSSYGLLFPEFILNIPKLGCLNIHPSLLPKLRGPAPIYWSLINGDKKTGVSIIKMDKKIDNGKILYQKEYKIKNNHTYKSLSNKLSNLGSYLLLKIFNKFFLKEQIKIKNQLSKSKYCTYARKISKLDSKLDFNENAEIIFRKIRAFNIWPIPYIYINKNKIYILSIKLKFNSIKFNNNNRKKILINNKKVFITTKKGLVNIIKIKLFNGKIVFEKDIINLNIFIHRSIINN